MRCLLFAVVSLVVVCVVVGCGLSFVVVCSLFLVCCLAFAVYRLLCVACRLWFIV